MDVKDFKAAMRHCAGAVALVTVGQGERRTGLTVTAVCSLSDRPPSLLTCVNRTSSAHPRIREEGAFGVNFLSDEHVVLALTFSGQKGIDGSDRFRFGEWRSGPTGSPILTDALLSFDCEVRQEIETETHSIYIGDIREARSKETSEPLVYLRGAFHGVEPMRELVSLGDLEARRMSWNGFS